MAVIRQPSDAMLQIGRGYFQRWNGLDRKTKNVFHRHVVPSAISPLFATLDSGDGEVP